MMDYLDNSDRKVVIQISVNERMLTLSTHGKHAYKAPTIQQSKYSRRKKNI